LFIKAAHKSSVVERIVIFEQSGKQQEGWLVYHFMRWTGLQALIITVY